LIETLVLGLVSTTALAGPTFFVVKTLDALGAVSPVPGGARFGLPKPPPLEITNDLVTGGAELNTAFPGWEAVTLQPPAAINVSSVPATEQLPVAENWIGRLTLENA
jgi:hypothetical protein